MTAENKNKFWISFGIGAGVSAVTLFALFLVLLGYFFFGGVREETEDLAEYTAVMTKYTNIQSGLMTFPEEIPEHTGESRFYFSYADTWDDPTCEIFLQCAYEPEVYEAELKRLENTGKRYGSVEKKLRREEEKFHYPAYVAIEDNNYAYEYALLSGENEITYVYLAFKEGRTIHFDKQYLPKGYGESDVLKVNPDPLSGYSIYQLGGEGGNNWNQPCFRNFL